MKSCYARHAFFLKLLKFLLREVMKFEGYSGAMCNKRVHSTMTRSSRFHCLIDVINKPTTDELLISPVYWRLAVAKFSKSTMQQFLT